MNRVLRRPGILKLLAALSAAALLAACVPEQAGAPLEPIDPTRRTMYYGGTILTMDPAQPAAGAILVRGEKIEAVGSDAEILALDDGSTDRVDLGGRVLMPGFVDAHTHLLNDARSQGQSLDEAQTRALRSGITTLGTLYVDRSFLNEIQTFADAGYLRVRTGLYLVATDPCGRLQGDWWKAHPPTFTAGEMLRINGVKIFTDGGACGRVALSFELEPGWGFGDLWFTQEELDALVAEVDAAGYQAAVHAIGDRAVQQALNAIEHTLAGRPNALRHRMEHVSVIRPEDLPRFGTLGVIPVLMGEFPNCTPYGPPVPEEFGHMEWPWLSLREANPNLTLAWHSDVPFQSINPFDHVLGFVTRIDHNGRAVCPPADWLIANTLPVAEALSIMTVQSAHALNRETEVGSLAPGKYADFIVLENNPLTQAPQDLADNRVLMTVVGGQVEYCVPGTGLCPGHANRPPDILPDTRPPVAVRWLVASMLLLMPVAVMLGHGRFPAFSRRVGGAGALLGGLTWLAALVYLNQLNDAWFVLFFVVPAFLFALGAAGLAARTGPRGLGIFGLWLALLGGISVAEGGVVSDWFRNDLGWGMFLFGLLGHTIGLVLFGLGTWKRTEIGLLRFLPIFVGLFGGPVPFGLSFILPESSDLPFLMLAAVLGGGWAILGFFILRPGKSFSQRTPAVAGRNIISKE